MGEIRYCEDCYAELPPRMGAPKLYCSDCTRTRWHPESEASRSHRLLREALDELFPFGLTDECPHRRLLR